MNGQNEPFEVTVVLWWILFFVWRHHVLEVEDHIKDDALISFGVHKGYQWTPEARLTRKKQKQKQNHLMRSVPHINLMQLINSQQHSVNKQPNKNDTSDLFLALAPLLHDTNLSLKHHRNAKGWVRLASRLRIWFHLCQLRLFFFPSMHSDYPLLLDATRLASGNGWHGE